MNGVSALWSAGENLLLQILVLFYNLTTSYGVAIILLTVLVRILLYPLSQKQMVSMQKMQKLQPRAKVLQEKYANDKETMNKEIMLLYKEHKVNPAAGCLPILVQLPILILLFNVLNNQEKLTTVLHLTKESFSFLGIHLHSSLYAVLGQALGIGSSPDVGIMAILSAMGTNIAGLAQVGLYGANALLVVVIAFLTWFQTQLSASSNPQMGNMNWFMTLFLTFICLGMPGGVLLYWVVSSAIGVGQQWWVYHRTEREMLEKPVLHKDKPR